MSITSASRAARPRGLSLRDALTKTIESLEQHQYQTAAQSLRELIKEHHVPPSVFSAAQTETLGQKQNRTGMSIATLGARISLLSQELGTASRFVKFLNGQNDNASDQISDTTYDVILGMIDLGTPTSLNYAANILISMPPSTIPLSLAKRFYDSGLDQPDLVAKIWYHCKDNDFPIPTLGGLVAVLKFLVNKKDYSEAIAIIGRLLKNHQPHAQRLPPEIPIDLAPDVLTYAIRAGATDQALRLWGMAMAEIGEPSRPPTPEQKLFFGNPQMTHALVRHFTKLASRPAHHLQGWHRAQLKGNPRRFAQTAERIYDAYAAVHGFDQSEVDTYIVADHYHITTSVACLFELNRFTDALEALETFFRRNEAPDNHDLGIILAALARRNAGRAVQILLEAAPTRIPGFRPTPHHYSVVLQQCLAQNKSAQAWRVLEHARNAGCGGLNPSVLDMFIRHSLEDIKKSWISGGPSRNAQSTSPLSEDTVKRMNLERLHTFQRVQDALQILGRDANIPTVRLAIERAISIRRPLIAWEIRMWAHRTGLLGETYLKDGKERKQWDEGKASAWQVARGLWSLHKRGVLDENEMWFKVRALGVDLPKEVEKRESFWSETFKKQDQLEDEAFETPMSLKRQPDSEATPTVSA